MAAVIQTATFPVGDGPINGRCERRFGMMSIAMLLMLVAVGGTGRSATNPWSMLDQPVSATYSFTPVSRHLYLYQANGQNPLDVTGTYQQYGYVFDANGNPMSVTFDAVGHILDFNNNVVGFVAA